MLVGFGSGSTTMLAIEETGRRVREEGLMITCLCASRASESAAHRERIPVLELDEETRPGLYIDGADQIDPLGRMIKGGGGALLREKILASRSAHRLILVDSTKPVPIIGRNFPLPVDVVPFAARLLLHQLKQQGADRTELRFRGDQMQVTDDGNLVIDCHFDGGLLEPEAAFEGIRRMPGVVEVGLFFQMCDELLVADADGNVGSRTFQTRF